MKNSIKRLLSNQSNKVIEKTTVSKWDGFLPVVNESLYKRKLITEKYETVTPNYSGLTIPISTRFFAQTLALDLVSVQPMSLPKNNLLYLDYNYESKNLYKRNLLVEIYKKPKKSYRPSYMGGMTRFVSPGTYTRDFTLTSFDLVTEPTLTGTTVGISSRGYSKGYSSVSRKVTGPTNKPQRIKAKKEFMKIFGNI